jgi:hypothetical protein
MIKSFFSEVVSSIFGFLYVPYHFIRTPLSTHKIAQSEHGLGLAIASLAFVFAMDVTLGHHTISVANELVRQSYVSYDQSPHVETIFDFDNTAPAKSKSATESVIDFGSLPFVGEVLTTIRIFFVLLFVIPASMVLLGKQKSADDFRQFMTLNMMLIGISGMIVLSISFLVVYAIYFSGGISQMTLLPIYLRLVPALFLFPMPFIFWISWYRMFPDIPLRRRALAFGVWLLGSIVITSVYRGISYALNMA